VLRGVGIADDLAHSSLRFSFGRFTDAAEIDNAAQQLATTVGRLRGS
jgi:cysteine desulfurase